VRVKSGVVHVKLFYKPTRLEVHLASDGEGTKKSEFVSSGLNLQHVSVIFLKPRKAHTWFLGCNQRCNRHKIWNKRKDPGQNLEMKL
jgi:hypothetical protein